MKKIAIIPAGGKGLRISSNLPKQFIKVDGKEIIAYTLDVFQSCEMIDEIIVPVSTDFIELMNSLKAKFGFTKITNIVEGGKERQDSVYNGLKNSGGKQGDLIIVHDAARPLLSKEILNRAIQSADEYDSVVVAIKAKDSLLVGKNDKVDHYIDRNETYYVQTPQIFRYEILLSAMESAYEQNYIGTDESMLVLNSSNSVKIVEGSIKNFKITTDSDLEMFADIVVK